MLRNSKSGTGTVTITKRYNLSNKQKRKDYNSSLYQQVKDTQKERQKPTIEKDKKLKSKVKVCKIQPNRDCIINLHRSPKQNSKNKKHRKSDTELCGTQKTCFYQPRLKFQIIGDHKQRYMDKIITKKASVAPKICEEVKRDKIMKSKKVGDSSCRTTFKDKLRNFLIGPKKLSKDACIGDNKRSIPRHKRISKLTESKSLKEIYKSPTTSHEKHRAPKLKDILSSNNVKVKYLDINNEEDNKQESVIFLEDVCVTGKTLTLWKKVKKCCSSQALLNNNANCSNTDLQRFSNGAKNNLLKPTNSYMNTKHECVIRTEEYERITAKPLKIPRHTNCFEEIKFESTELSNNNSSKKHSKSESKVRCSKQFKFNLDEMLKNTEQELKPANYLTSSIANPKLSSRNTTCRVKKNQQNESMSLAKLLENIKLNTKPHASKSFNWFQKAKPYSKSETLCLAEQNVSVDAPKPELLKCTKIEHKVKCNCFNDKNTLKSVSVSCSEKKDHKNVATSIDYNARPSKWLEIATINSKKLLSCFISQNTKYTNTKIERTEKFTQFTKQNVTKGTNPYTRKDCTRNANQSMTDKISTKLDVKNYRTRFAHQNATRCTNRILYRNNKNKSINLIDQNTSKSASWLNHVKPCPLTNCIYFANKNRSRLPNKLNEKKNILCNITDHNLPKSSCWTKNPKTYCICFADQKPTKCIYWTKTPKVYCPIFDVKNLRNSCFWHNERNPKVISHCFPEKKSSQLTKKLKYARNSCNFTNQNVSKFTCWAEKPKTYCNSFDGRSANPKIVSQCFTEKHALGCASLINKRHCCHNNYLNTCIDNNKERCKILQNRKPKSVSILNLLRRKLACDNSRQSIISSKTTKIVDIKRAPSRRYKYCKSTTNKYSSRHLPFNGFRKQFRNLSEIFRRKQVEIKKSSCNKQSQGCNSKQMKTSKVKKNIRNQIYVTCKPGYPAVKTEIKTKVSKSKFINKTGKYIKIKNTKSCSTEKGHNKNCVIKRKNPVNICHTNKCKTRFTTVQQNINNFCCRKRKKQRCRSKCKKEDIDCKQMYLLTMQNPPCVFLYKLCPGLYPRILSLLNIYKRLGNMIMFSLAVLVWCPCILALESTRLIFSCKMC